MKKRIIYADHAATTALSPSAYEVMKPWLQDQYGNPSTLYRLAREPRKAIQTARETIAACIGANPEEVFFTSCGTEADNWAIKGSAFSDPYKRATITSSFEHHAVLNSCKTIEHFGYPVEYMMPTENGYITTDILREYISSNTRLVSVMMANNEIGSVQPIERLCELAHSNGALFHTDAVQAVGHMPIKVKRLGIDMLSASAHKFNGPKGVGFLYVRDGTMLNSFMDGGAQEHSMRAGTENVAGIVGMAAALHECCEELESRQRQILKTESTLLKQLGASNIKFSLNGGQDRIPGILSLSFPGAEGEAILHRLDLMGIYISTGSACNSEKTKVSHVLKAIRLDDEAALGTVRISLGHENTEEDAIDISNTLIMILQQRK